MSSLQNSSTALWYLVQCKVRQDERAEDNLRLQGYECLRPTFTRERLIRGQLKVATESLFPGYLFIQLDENSNWAPLRSTRGVLRVVGFGGVPLSVDGAIIARLRERAQQEAFRSALEPGQLVRILDGPFAELEAIFLAMDGDERVVLLLQLLHREQKVRFPLKGVVGI